MAKASIGSRWLAHGKAIAEEERKHKPKPVADPLSQMAEWALPLVTQKHRYKCLFGGRGSGKSFAVADALLILAMRSRIRVLCCREFQNSIKESSHYLLSERIDALGFGHMFDVQETRIINTENGSEFIFKGIRLNTQSIKSMAGITHCWVEEGQSITAESWRILVPTIREPESEIWVTFNPLNEEDPVYQDFVIDPKKGAYIRQVNWDLNPYFPAVLDDERREMQEKDPDAYLHIWEGGLWAKSDAQVLSGKWEISDFEPQHNWEGPFIGADWGFAKDPTALAESWIYDDCLYVRRESVHVALELDDTARVWREDVPGCDRHMIRADSARPESISHVRGKGMPGLVAAKKGPGSVEDGIAYLRQFKRIYIHNSCKEAALEARLYKYKVDPRTEKILPVVVDAHNHVWDAIRYSLELKMKAHKQRRNRPRSRQGR